MTQLRVALLTREYPPEVYGGAGVHVTYLARELAGLVDLTVHCQGADRPGAVAHRPWDRLGGGHPALRAGSTHPSMTSAPRAAYPAIPPGRVRVIRTGTDTGESAPDPGTDVLELYGVDPGRPCVVFVGRITRQKGLPVLLRAAQQLDPAAQLVLCAGQPDTAGLAEEVTGLVAGLKVERSGVIWLPEMLPQREVIQLLTHATVFAC